MARADRLEAAGRDFHRRVHDGFLQQAITDPERFAVIDGTQSEEAVADADVADRLDAVPRPRVRG